MKDNIQFLQAFLKNPLKVGAIAPSSPELARMMLKGIEPNEDNIIVELGVGTGAITKYISQVIPDERSYLGIEVNPNLVRSLHTKYPELNIVCGNACETSRIHKESGLGKIGYVLCCLPFVTLPGEVAKGVLSEVEQLMDKGCTFRAFQYAHGYYSPSALKLREFMRSRYGRSRRSPLVVKNVPPAYTLTWSTL
jgi:phospholipid N-methyltransferase